MAKFIMSIGNEVFKLLGSEAKDRDVTLQQLLRAVIVPDWIKQNLAGQASTPQGSNPSGYRISVKDNDLLVSPASRLRR